MLSACTDSACVLTYRNKGTPGQDNWRPLIASVGRPANTWLVGIPALDKGHCHGRLLHAMRATRAFCVALPMGFVSPNPLLFFGLVERRPLV